MLLGMPDTQLVTVPGPCGIGRTRLAREVARTFARPGGAVLLTVRPDWSLTQIPGALARALRQPEQQKVDPGEGRSGAGTHAAGGGQ